MPSPPLIIAAANRKGGAGKTSLCLHLAGASSSRGKPTLIIDLDPQGSITQAFEGSQFYERLEDRRSAAVLFDDGFAGDPAGLILPTRWHNLCFLPASDGLGRFNFHDPLERGNLQDAVRQFVAASAPYFEVVLIDTAPNLQMLTWCALIAADHVLTPLVPEDFSAQGLIFVKRFIEAARGQRNNKLQWMGLVLQMVQPRLGTHIAYEKALRHAYGDLVFPTRIPLCAPVKQAVANRAPVTLFKPRVAAAKLYQQLFDEVLDRADKMEVK